MATTTVAAGSGDLHRARRGRRPAPSAVPHAWGLRTLSLWASWGRTRCQTAVSFDSFKPARTRRGLPFSLRALYGECAVRSPCRNRRNELEGWDDAGSEGPCVSGPGGVSRLADSHGEGGKRVWSPGDFQGGRCWREESAGLAVRAGRMAKVFGKLAAEGNGSNGGDPPATHVVGSLKGEAGKPAAHSAWRTDPNGSNGGEFGEREAVSRVLAPSRIGSNGTPGVVTVREWRNPGWSPRRACRGFAGLAERGAVPEAVRWQICRRSPGCARRAGLGSRACPLGAYRSVRP